MGNKKFWIKSYGLGKKVVNYKAERLGGRIPIVDEAGKSPLTT